MPSHLAPRFGVLGTAASILFGASCVHRGTLANRKWNRPSTGRHDLYPRYSRGHTVHPGWHSYGRASTRTVSRNYRGLAGFVLKGEGAMTASLESDIGAGCPISRVLCEKWGLPSELPTRRS